MLDLLRQHAKDAFVVLTHLVTRPENIGIDRLQWLMSHNLNTFLIAVETLKLTQAQILDLSGIYLTVKWVGDFGEVWNEITLENGFALEPIANPKEDYDSFIRSIKRRNCWTSHIFEQLSSVQVIKRWASPLHSLALKANSIHLKIEIDFSRIVIAGRSEPFVIQPMMYESDFGCTVNLFNHLVTAQLMTKLFWPDDLLQEHADRVRECPYTIITD